MAKLIVHNPPTVKLKASGYTGTPTGDIELTENNRTYNVSPFATATTAIPEEEKTVTPSTVEQTVTPDEGLLKKVTVNPTPLEEKTVTPTTEQQTIVPQSPAIGFSEVTIEPVTPSIDPDIQPQNIKQGVDILGVQGTLKPPTLITKQITENGVYKAEDDNADGYSQVNVGVYEVESYLANTLTSVTLPTLTSIPNKAFDSKSALVSVSAPNATSLGAYAFNRCLNLETISFSNQMTSIGEECFCNCPKLLLSELPDTITTIRARAFQSSEKIAITKLPSSITSIGNYAFYDCRAIPFLDMTNMPMVPPTLGSNVFLTRRKLIFYFDTQAKLDAYSAATNWSTYADSFQIKPSEV